MPSTFEADLRAVREERGLSLDEIQRETRIPVDVLRRFEEGGLVGDPTYNDVYLRAFLQSYAKAVGLPVAKVMDAYQQHTAGSYSGGLADTDAAPPRATDAPPPEPAAPAPPPPAAGGAAPAVEALASAPDPEARRPEPEPPRPATTRVSRPAVPTAKRSFDKNWTLILGLFALAVLGLAAVVYVLFSGDDVPDADGPDTIAIGDGATAEIDTSGVGAGAAGGGPQLQIPITVTVEAGGDGLQWFRVTEDADDRTPYWIDLGSQQEFSADSALVLWGEGNEAGPALAFEEATVVFQGVRFTPRNGVPLRITPATGQRILDSLATAGQ